MEEDNSWVFDSLVCFLNGPIWNAPLQTFIEEKSLIFESSVDENEEYIKIFEEFKNLVDFMLGNFMEDIGISSEQFELACKEGKKYQMAFDHNLFEQIWAANDYEIFKRMMTQRNVELQLQALELIERKYGITPESFIPKNKEANAREMPITIEKPPNFEHEIMEEISKNFRAEGPASLDMENILEEKELLEKELKETKENAVPLVESSGKAIESLKEKPITTGGQKSVPQKISHEVDTLELKKRQEYLRAQRDKLVALKKDARLKQLDIENDKEDKSKARPKSARAAGAVMTGEKAKIGPQQLQLRKTLAERLRSEVVSGKK